jgi:hypothetical protein
MRPVPWFPLDDTYITIHSAQVLHWGFDPNFPGVSALYGSTSAPFLALEYVLQYVLPPLYAADAACWLGVLAYTLGLVYLTRRLRLDRFESVAIVTLGLASSFVPVHLLNGLETGFCLAGVIWTVALGSGERPHSRLAALAGGCTAAIRPDLAPFTLLVLAALTYERWHLRRCSLRRAALDFFGLMGLALLPVLPFAIWYLRQTGLPYPLTGLAKQYYFASGHLPWSRKLAPVADELSIYAMSCGPLLFGFFAGWRSSIGKAIWVFAAVMGIVAYRTMPDYLFFNIFRYPVVLIPMLVWGVAEWVSKRKSGEAGRMLILACLVWCAMFIVPAGIRNYLQACRTSDEGQRQLVSWCQQNLPADARILVQDAGYVAYGSHFRIVDYVGLKTPQAIALNKEYTWANGGAGRAEVIAALANEEDARYLVVSSLYPPSNQLPGQLTALGWGVRPLRRNGFYLVYGLHAPEPTSMR